MNFNKKAREKQKELVSQVLQKLQQHNRVLLNSACSSGKTFMALGMIGEWVKNSIARIAISTYDKKSIRKQWVEEIKDKEPSLLGKIIVVCASHDLEYYKKLGVSACTSNDQDKIQSKQIVIMIPQSIRKNKACNIGKIEYFIIDEVHERLSKDSILWRFIENNKEMKVLGLTGTGFELLGEDNFFKEAIIYDMVSAYRDKIISDIKLTIEYFNFKLINKFYDSKGILNRQGVGFLKKQGIVYNDKLSNLIKNRKIEGKTLIIIPHTQRLIGETILAEKVCNIINLAGYKAVHLIGDMPELIKDKNEKLFRSPVSGVNFMVVIDMCGTGWDFPALNNVIDLTFTTNPKVIIQRFSRAIRLHKNKNMPRYFYCADKSKTEKMAKFYIGRALELTKESGIRNYDDKSYIDYSKLQKDDSDNDYIEFGTATSYFDIDKIFQGGYSKTIFRKSLREIVQEDFSFNDVALILMDFFRYVRNNDVVCKDDFINSLIEINNKEKDGILKIKKQLEVIREQFPDIFKIVYGNNSNQEILFNKGI